MDDRVLSDLEFPKVLDLLRSETATPPGAALALALRPSPDERTIRAEQALTVEAGVYLERRGALPFGTLPDPDPLLERLAVEGSILAPLEVFDLLAVMQAGRNVKSALTEARSDCPGLWSRVRDFPDLGNLLRFLDGKIASSGEVLDQASDELRALRQQVQERSRRLDVMLEEISSRPEVARALQDDFVSLRHDRHVIPIRTEAKSAFQGIVHGVSGTGATVYVEPLETVDLNNEIVTLRDRESAEVKRLLQEYSELLRGRLAELRALRNGIGHLDLLMAKARLGRAMRAVPPETAAESGVLLRAARHPLVEINRRSQGEDIVPLDLALPPGRPVLLISGPNTGGKTVALKTVGLLALMFQSGIPVPAEHAVLPIFRGIYVDIGDHQSIQDQLSTFSARMRTMSEIARRLEPPTLVLLDEVGTGTDPEEGVALGIAILEYLRGRGATVIATTHLEALKAHAASAEGCANAAMQFDETNFAPTYRLVQGIPGRSGALEIAARLGLPEEILVEARARHGRSGGLISGYLARLQEMSADLEAKLAMVSAEAARLRGERAAMEADLKQREERHRQAVAAEIELALNAMRGEGQRYLEDLKNREVAAIMRREEARAAARLRSEARRLIGSVTRRPVSDRGEEANIVPGSSVSVDGMGMRGVVESVQGDRVVLLVRGKRVTVRRQDCNTDSPSDRSAGAPPRLPRGVTLTRRPTEAAGEIQLRGMTVEDALDQVDKFLDDASLASLSQVRLVHGVGSGRLKRAVSELLARHPHVQAFAGAPPDQGGAGVTIVTLKT